VDSISGVSKLTVDLGSEMVMLLRYEKHFIFIEDELRKIRLLAICFHFLSLVFRGKFATS